MKYVLGRCDPDEWDISQAALACCYGKGGARLLGEMLSMQKLTAAMQAACVEHTCQYATCTT